MGKRNHKTGAIEVSISQGIEIGMKARGMRLKDLDVPLAPSTKSMIKNGKRNLPRDLAGKIVEQLRHPALPMAVVVDETGVGSVWLDGPNIDIHRSSVKERAVVEIQEALEALIRFRSSNPPCLMTDGDHRKLNDLFMELLDAREWIDFAVAIFCEDYGHDFLHVNSEHRRRLRSMKLVSS